MRLRTLWTLLHRTATEWYEDRVSRLSAALAFYTAFSIAPILVIAIAIAGAFVAPELARREVADQLRELMGETAANAIELMLARAAQPGAGGRWATIFGILLLLYGATNVFAELQDSMNLIWQVKPKPRQFWWQILRDRLLSFVMVLGTVFLLLVSLIVSAVLAAASRYLAGSEVWWNLINGGASLVIFTLLFAALFKWVPDVKIAWRDVWIGALLTAALFTLGKFLIGLYLGQGSVSSVYGAAGSLAILLIWVYFSAQILFLGAEFTQVYAHRHGEHIQPADNALEMETPKKKREQ